MVHDKTKTYTLRRLRTSYITTIVSISLVLFMLSIIGLLVINTQKLSTYVKENIGFSVILKDNVKEADKIWIQKELDATYYVKSTEYINKEKAAEDLKEQLGEDFVGFLGYNPLLASIDVRLFADYANPDSIARIKDDILNYSQVKEVLYQESLVHLVNKNVKRIGLVIAIFSLLLLIIAIALINNTIRLQVYSKRFSIKTMQLVGATDGFIRKPFLVKSTIYGMLGAAIALIFLYAAVFFLQKQFDEIVYISGLGLLSFFTVATGILLTLTSTYLSVNKYLRLNVDQLYY